MGLYYDFYNLLLLTFFNNTLPNWQAEWWIIGAILVVCSFILCYAFYIGICIIRMLTHIFNGLINMLGGGEKN
jgi:hypothetical protein